jgi:hypothetical protein
MRRIRTLFITSTFLSFAGGPQTLLPTIGGNMVIQNMFCKEILSVSEKESEEDEILRRSAERKVRG